MAELYHEKGDLSMAIRTYLAMTAAEFTMTNPLPSHIAWMSCHFSPYGTGLSNLPPFLPSGSLLILNDRIPIHGHDPQRISEQLKHAAAALHCSGILLDFQRPGCAETEMLAKHLVSVLPVPVYVSDLYAEKTDCPVFLSPCPHHICLRNHIFPWKGREILLDLATNAESIIIRKNGYTITPLPFCEISKFGKPEFGEENLHCHYTIKVSEDLIHFTLWRTSTDIDRLCREAESMGISAFAQLYHEFSKFSP